MQVSRDARAGLSWLLLPIKLTTQPSPLSISTLWGQTCSLQLTSKVLLQRSSSCNTLKTDAALYVCHDQRVDATGERRPTDHGVSLFLLHGQTDSQTHIKIDRYHQSQKREKERQIYIDRQQDGQAPYNQTER